MLPALLVCGCAHFAEPAAAAEPASSGTTPDDAATIRIYRTPEEQRDAGLKRRLTPWLTVSGLAEGEMSHDRFDTGDGDESERQSSASVQLGLTVAPAEAAQAEVILEYDTDEDRLRADEAFVVLESGPWELALGKQYTPFGVYFSNFVSSPLLAFGETHVPQAATLVYGPRAGFDVSLTAYRGRTHPRTDDGRRWKWSLAAEADLGTGWSAGLSYQSDLADADSRPLADIDTRYARRVAGVGAYLLWAGERFAVTLEALSATRSFRATDPELGTPRAWNLELANFHPRSKFEIAFRIEGGRALPDAPELQLGPALTWRAAKNVSITAEYLHGEFDHPDLPNHAERIATLISLAF